MEVKVDLKTHNNKPFHKRRFTCEISVPNLSARQYLYLPLEHPYGQLGPSGDGVADDLLFVAGCCYVIDQLVPRTVPDDNWTRELEICLPVEEPGRWNNISTALSKTLTFLTGDQWSFSFCQRQGPIYRSRQYQLVSSSASAVCLFSGGLDSLLGAINYLSEHDEPLILVGHYDLGSTAKKAQARLAQRLAQTHHPHRFNLIQARVGPIQRRQSGKGPHARVLMPSRETTLRSRSLVFLALGLYVAHRQHTESSIPVLMPENGFIALNPPLTPARLGSCSTRTAHPSFLAQFQAIIYELGLEHPIQNPFAGQTKGQILASAPDFELAKNLADKTISCAHPTRRQGWIRRDVSHCGYCIPCLFRRAALHRVGLDQGEAYGYDVCTGELELERKIATNLRAVLSWLYDARTGEATPQQLVDRMLLPPGMQATAVQVIQAGLDEMTQFIQDKATPNLKAWAGLE